ncbi:hypothetical protein FOPE_07617 [Fonsecaea pedrosoi]|nr:hypothetical protein FOPE_07617 [Fonsecaea pedrosoi]
MPLLSSTLLLRTHSLTLLTCAYYLLTSPAQLLSSTPIWLLGESMSARPAGYAPETSPHDASASLGARAGSSGRTSTNPGKHLTGLLSTQAHGISHSERELFALLALVVVAYAVTQFLFAGDLSMSQQGPGAGAGAGGAASSNASAPPSSLATRLDPSAKSPSRHAEELHTLLTAQSRWLTLSAIHVLASSTLVFWIYMFHSHSASSAPVSSTFPSDSGTSLLSGLNLLPNRVVFTIGLADMLFWGYLWTVLKEEGREVAKVLARWRRQAEDDE